jgi:hypothetical protein
MLTNIINCCKLRCCYHLVWHIYNVYIYIFNYPSNVGKSACKSWGIELARTKPITNPKRSMARFFAEFGDEGSGRITTDGNERRFLAASALR